MTDEDENPTRLSVSVSGNDVLLRGECVAGPVIRREPSPRNLGIEMIEFPSDGSGPLVHFSDGRTSERLVTDGGWGEWEYQAVGTMIVWRHECGAHSLVPQCVRCAARTEEPRAKDARVADLERRLSLALRDAGEAGDRRDWDGANAAEEKVEAIRAELQKLTEEPR